MRLHVTPRGVRGRFSRVSCGNFLKRSLRVSYSGCLHGGWLRNLLEVRSYLAHSPENFGGFFFELAWEFCIEKRRGFLVNFFGLRFPQHEA